MTWYARFPPTRTRGSEEGEGGATEDAQLEEDDTTLEEAEAFEDKTLSAHRDALDRVDGDEYEPRAIAESCIAPTVDGKAASLLAVEEEAEDEAATISEHAVGDEPASLVDEKETEDATTSLSREEEDMGEEEDCGRCYLCREILRRCDDSGYMPCHRPCTAFLCIARLPGPSVIHFASCNAV